MSRESINLLHKERRVSDELRVQLAKAEERITELEKGLELVILNPSRCSEHAYNALKKGPPPT